MRLLYKVCKKDSNNVDAKSILYLRLAKECSGILMKFSIELSKYILTLPHTWRTKHSIRCTQQTT